MYGTVEELEPCTVCGAVAPRMVDIEVVDAGAPPWPLVPDPAWTSTVAPSLPFLQWHEHVALRLVGMTTLEMPASPFFSLFLRKGGGHAKRYNAARGIAKYDEGDWRDDRAAAGKVRRVTYEVDVVDDASRSRRVAVHETQSIVPTADGYVYEARTVEAGCEAVARAAAPAAPTSPYGRRSDGGPAYYTAERWVVAEQKGILRAHAKVSVYAAAPPSPDGPGGGWTDEAHRRFDAWHAVATRETYANAVGAMVSDSVFGTAVGGGERRKQGDAEPRPFVAPVPPSRVDFMTQLEEPPLVRERAPAKGPADEPSPRARGVSTVVCVDVEERGDAAKPAKKSGLGCGEAPWAAGAVPVLEKAATPSKRASWLGGYAASLLSPKRASGSTYEIVFDGVVGLQFADLGTGALVDGHEGYVAADAPPGVGSALTSVNGVRVSGLTFQSAMALAGQRKRPLALGFLEATPDALVDTLLVERTIGGCDARAVDAALAAPGAKELRGQLDAFVANFNAADLRKCAYVGGDQRPGAMFKRAVDFAVDQLREKQLLTSGSPKPQQNKTAALRVSRRDDDAEERDDAYWASCRKILEKRLAARVADAAWGLSPEAGAGDDELRVHFHSLRFLRLEHLGVVVPAGKARGQTSAPEDGAEWRVAQLEVEAACAARTAGDAVDRFATAVRFIASAVEACSNRGRTLQCYSAIGADELLPAITWTLIQADAKTLASTLWFVDEFAGADDLRGERGYAFANVQAASDFARKTLTSAAPLEGLIAPDAFDQGVRRAVLTDEAVAAATRGDGSKLGLVLAAGADPLGLGSGLDATPLSAAIVSRDRDAIAKCLGRLSIEGASNGADDRVELECHDVDNARPSDGATALMVAASVGDLDVVLALLALGADGHRRTDATGRTAARRARDGGHESVAEVLACAAPTPAALLRACAVGDAAAVRGLLLRGADPAAKVGGCPPLVAAAAAGSGACVAALLAADGVDVDATCAKGSTALMRCVGFDERCAARHGAPAAAPAKQAAAAIALLRKGADRGLQDRFGKSALTWCRTQGGSKALESVLRNDPAKKKLCEACRDRRPDDARALLLQGADADAPCEAKGYTPLVAAVYNDDVAMATILLDPPVEPDGSRAFAAAAVDGRGRGGLTPLMYAAQRRSAATSSLLLRFGAARDAVDDRGRSPRDHAAAGNWPAGSEAAKAELLELLSTDPRKLLLVEAAARDDAAKVSALLGHGVSPNECRRLRSARRAPPRAPPRGGRPPAKAPPPLPCWHLELCTPLMAACCYDAAAAARALLRSGGCRVDLANPLGLTALHYAALRGRASTILLLLECGADRTLADRAGRTALDWAERRAAMDSAAFRRADRAPDEPASFEAALTTTGGVDRADELAVHVLRYSPETHGATALAADGDDRGVVALVMQGVDVNGFDDGGATPLIAACGHGRLAVVRRLLAHRDVAVDLAGKRGVTPLMHAAAAGFDDGVLALLRKGADRRKRTDQGRRAADYAAEHGHVALGALLEADPDVVSVHDVATEGRLLALDGLIRQRPDLLNARDAARGDAPLLLAAKHRKLKAVELLLAKDKVKVDCPNANRETPLMHAAKAGALDICSRLLAKGADPNAKDADGRTAISWASSKSYANMMLYMGVAAMS